MGQELLLISDDTGEAKPINGVTLTFDVEQKWE